MGFDNDPAPLGGWGVEDSLHSVSFSNFAATIDSIPKLVSRLEQGASESIDAFSNANYAFREVPVGFRISIPPKIPGAAAANLFRGLDERQARLGCQAHYKIADKTLGSG